MQKLDVKNLRISEFNETIYLNVFPNIPSGIQVRKNRVLIYIRINLH
jgi:hypothetical protein